MPLIVATQQTNKSSKKVIFLANKPKCSIKNSGENKKAQEKTSEWQQQHQQQQTWRQTEQWKRAAAKDWTMRMVIIFAKPTTRC